MQLVFFFFYIRWLTLLCGFGFGKDEGNYLVGTLSNTVFCVLVLLASSLETFFYVYIGISVKAYKQLSDYHESSD